MSNPNQKDADEYFKELGYDQALPTKEEEAQWMKQEQVGSGE